MSESKYFFGHIDGTSVGQVFASREELSKAGIHKPLMAGIWGSQEGACSIVLSGGYEDDIDNLDHIIYTGQGGQNIPGGKQIADQKFTKGNKGLKLSCDYNLPIRVTRSSRIKNGPEKGYRYDGLYYVKSLERVKGERGFYIFRFHLLSEKSIGELELILKPNYASTLRKKVTTNKLQRNVKLSEKIKEIYSNRCQVCDVLLQSPFGPIATGAHIKGLGKPHDGPDSIENMLCLCPNHHSQFDKFTFYIEPKNLQIIGLESFTNKKIKLDDRHNLNNKFLQYHKELVLINSKK